MTGLPEITVIGLCGVTCSGKTSLSKLIYDYFKIPSSDVNIDKKYSKYDFKKQTQFKNVARYKGVCVESILMDNYFLPVDSPQHVVIPELNHINWDVITSLDIDRMVLDITSAIERFKSLAFLRAVLIIDGFLVLNSARLKSLCDLKLFVDLDYETCFERRSKRVYDPPDVPGYFEKVVWPESQKHKALILNSTPDLHVLSGSVPLETNFKKILEIIYQHWSHS